MDEIPEGCFSDCLQTWPYYSWSGIFNGNQNRGLPANHFWRRALLCSPSPPHLIQFLCCGVVPAGFEWFTNKLILAASAEPRKRQPEGRNVRRWFRQYQGAAGKSKTGSPQLPLSRSQSLKPLHVNSSERDRDTCIPRIRSSGVKWLAAFGRWLLGLVVDTSQALCHFWSP